MFKRIEKRQRKQDKEEELGLTEEMKEVLGMHDTDSEESNSGSEEESGSSDADSDDEGAEVSLAGVGHGGDELEEDEDEGEENIEEEDEDTSGDEVPPLSVTEAMRDPLYVVSQEPPIKACAICPRKLLKNETMEEVHRTSKAHYRRFSRFVEFAGNADPETDVSDFWRTLNAESKAKEPVKQEGQMSKRAEKRKAKMKALKAKREVAKAMKAKKLKRKQPATAKIAAATESKDEITPPPPSDSTKKPSSTCTKPPHKKRKVHHEQGTKGTKPAAQARTVVPSSSLDNSSKINSEVPVPVSVEPAPPASPSKSKPPLKHEHKSESGGRPNGVKSRPDKSDMKPLDQHSTKKPSKSREKQDATK